MIALLNLSVLGFSFVVFHDKARRTQQGNLLARNTLNQQICYIGQSTWQLLFNFNLYLDFHLLCSMTKLKEYSREICYSPPCLAPSHHTLLQYIIHHEGALMNIQLSMRILSHCYGRRSPIARGPWALLWSSFPGGFVTTVGAPLKNIIRQSKRCRF